MGIRTTLCFIFLSATNLIGCYSQKFLKIAVTDNGRFLGVYLIGANDKIYRYEFDDSTENVEIKYFYNSEGEIEKISSINNLNGKESNSDVEDFEEEIQEIKDATYRFTYLKTKGIPFPLPIINSSELSDMVKIIASSDTFTTIHDGTRKVLVFDSLDQKISFRTKIERYIPILTPINKYILQINGDKLISEEIYFAGGVLLRKYFYDSKNRLMKISWKSTYDDKQEYTENKNFVYLNGS